MNDAQERMISEAQMLLDGETNSKPLRVIVELQLALLGLVEGSKPPQGNERTWRNVRMPTDEAMTNALKALKYAEEYLS